MQQPEHWDCFLPSCLFLKNSEICNLKTGYTLEKKKLFIETYGCQMNVADSEVVAAILQDRSYEPVTSADGADAIFLNTCSVRDNAEQRIWRRLDYFKSLKKKNKQLIVGVLGCMAERIGY